MEGGTGGEEDVRGAYERFITRSSARGVELHKWADAETIGEPAAVWRGLTRRVPAGGARNAAKASYIVSLPWS